MTKFKAIALNIIFVVVIAILIVANVLANFWSGALTLALGSIGGYNPEGTQYFTSEFEKDEDLISAQEAFSLDVVEEGAVLLKNDGEALPLAENERNISVFSINQREWVRNGSGSSSVPLNPNYANKTIMASLKDAGGLFISVQWRTGVPASESRDQRKSLRDSSAYILIRSFSTSSYHLASLVRAASLCLH